MLPPCHILRGGINRQTQDVAGRSWLVILQSCRGLLTGLCGHSIAQLLIFWSAETHRFQREDALAKETELNQCLAMLEYALMDAWIRKWTSSGCEC